MFYHKTEILIGKRFGFLVVVRYKGKHFGKHMWHVRCDCNKLKLVTERYLTRSVNPSCGCRTGGILKQAYLTDKGQRLVAKLKAYQKGKTFLFKKKIAKLSYQEKRCYNAWLNLLNKIQDCLSNTEHERANKAQTVEEKEVDEAKQKVLNEKILGDIINESDSIKD